MDVYYESMDLIQTTQCSQSSSIKILNCLIGEIIIKTVCRFRVLDRANNYKNVAVFGFENCYLANFDYV